MIALILCSATLNIAGVEKIQQQQQQQQQQNTLLLVVAVTLEAILRHRGKSF